MSSSYVRSHHEFGSQHVESSPPPDPWTNIDLSEPLIRPMRLKVLYTFDNENRTNCLARWPEIVNIRTVHLDESTQVGIIDLKTCVKTILNASPEITAKLGQDYTVYAYDYSEYETPLVGQGMLSKVLATSSAPMPAPANQSSTLVTGRVCKNILGIFNNGVQETLEVKLRLVPVPTTFQNEYNENMKRYRDMSRVTPEGFDPQAWADLVKSNPGVLTLVNQSRGHSPGTPIDSNGHGLERVQQLVNEGYGIPSTKPSLVHSRRNSSTTTILSGHETVRLGSPTPSSQSMTASQPAQTVYGHYSRAASRASERDFNTRHRRPSTGSMPDTEYASQDDRQIEEPSRKRAKVTKADHPGKSGFGNSLDSLRITASTAASVRVFQPTALRPSMESTLSMESLPRAPTPVPQHQQYNKKPPLVSNKSSLGQAVMTSDSGYKSFYTNSDTSSPEKVQTPRRNLVQDIASSPPMVRELSAVPSSPVLPMLPPPLDPSFSDAHADGIFEDADNVDISLAEDGNYLPSQSHAKSIGHDAFVPERDEMALQNAQALEAQEAAEAKKRDLSMRNARRAVGLKRSQTWSGEQPSSDPPRASKRKSRARAESSTPKSRGGWDKDKRKKAIESKLNSSIEAGEMPPFCENCGAIETPTWRKAYSRLHSGDHTQVDMSNDESGIVALQVIEKNDDGSSKVFKIFKKNRTNDPEDEGFTDVLLCNPCGIWLSKQKCMRPSNLWAGKEKTKSDASKDKPRRSRAKKRADSEAEGNRSDALAIPSEAMTIASEASTPPCAFDHQPNDISGGDISAETSNQVNIGPQQTQTSIESRNNSASAPFDKDFGESMPVIDLSSVAALQRAIRSSPGQDSFLGSRQSPIELDKASPDPARKSLFSSPKTNGPLGLSASSKMNASRKAPRTPNECHNQQNSKATGSASDHADKENLPPSLTRPSTPDDGLDDLFASFSPMVTPSRGVAELLRTPGNLFKTPAPRSSPNHRPLATGDFFSTAAKAILHPRTPSRTPSRQIRNSDLDMTPFSMHLNQLLSENPNTSPAQLFSELDLPALEAVSELHEDQTNMNDGGTPSRIFRNAEFDFGVFTSSDLPVPSSPPAWFGVYEDPTDVDEHQPEWRHETGAARQGKVLQEESSKKGLLHDRDDDAAEEAAKHTNDTTTTG